MYIGNPWRKLDHSSIYNKKLPWRELRNQMVDRQGFEPWTWIKRSLLWPAELTVQLC